jgi:hypothetical protein
MTALREGSLNWARTFAFCALSGDGYFVYLNTDRLFGTTYELIERPKRRHEPEAVFPC